MTDDEEIRYHIQIEDSTAERMVALGLLEEVTIHQFTAKGLAMIDAWGEMSEAKQAEAIAHEQQQQGKPSRSEPDASRSE